MDFSLKNIDAIVFDMDGIIFDTEKIALESWIILGERYGLADVEFYAKSCIGRSTVDTMKILNDAYGDKVNIDKIHGECREVYAEIISERGIPLKEGAVELLEWLLKMGVKVGMASSSTYHSVMKNLESANLQEFFQVIVGGDMISHSKPEPEIYLTACEKLGVSPQNCLAVEDSYNGIISAFRAGMKPVLVPDLIEPNEEMLEKSSAVFKSLREFLEKLKSANEGL